MASVIVSECKLMFKNTRLNRVRYFAYVSFFYLFFGLCLGLYDATLGTYLHTIRASIEQSIVLSLVAIVAQILGIIVSFPLMVLPFWWLCRRVNDTGMSAKWLFALLAFSFLLLLLGGLSKELIAGKAEILSSACLITAFCVFCLVLIISLVVTLRKGSLANNRYGEPPPKNNFLTYTFCSIYFIFTILGFFLAIGGI